MALARHILFKRKESGADGPVGQFIAGNMFLELCAALEVFRELWGYPGYRAEPVVRLVPLYPRGRACIRLMRD